MKTDTNTEPKTKHTPGPWKTDKLPSIGIDGNESFTWGVLTGDGYKVGLLGKNQEANARLIASAPYLLEACKMLVASLSPDNSRIDNPLGVKAICDAIAKAEGK